MDYLGDRVSRGTNLSFCPRAMLARLGNRLEFLTGGARELPARQQTLRGAIAWSYDLLNENEQRLFRQMSVFVGGCTLDAVEAVSHDHQTYDSLLDQFGSLLDKSLLREVEGISDEPRFIMLELLREFGLEQLKVSAEQEVTRLRHASFFLALATGRSKTGEYGPARMDQSHGTGTRQFASCARME